MVAAGLGWWQTAGGVFRQELDQDHTATVSIARSQRLDRIMWRGTNVFFRDVAPRLLSFECAGHWQHLPGKQSSLLVTLSVTKQVVSASGQILGRHPRLTTQPNMQKST